MKAATVTEPENTEDSVTVLDLPGPVSAATGLKTQTQKPT